MSEETVSLKEHLEKILCEKDKALNAALASAKEAVIVAEANSQRWRENANEWRNAMNDKDKLLATKTDLENIEKELVEFRKFKEDRAGVPSDICTLKTDVKALNTFKDNMQGKASQSSLNTVTIISIVSLLIGGIGLILRLFGS